MVCEKARQLWAVAPHLFAINVLTPSTAWRMHSANRLVAVNYRELMLSWQRAAKPRLYSGPSGAAKNSLPQEKPYLVARGDLNPAPYRAEAGSTPALPACMKLIQLYYY